MSSTWRHSSTRHGDKLSFGVYNPGGVSNYKWAIVKEHFQCTDLLVGHGRAGGRWRAQVMHLSGLFLTPLFAALADARGRRFLLTLGTRFAAAVRCARRPGPAWLVDGRHRSLTQPSCVRAYS
jgi:hypothetical protein